MTEKDKSGLRGFAKDHLTVNHIQEEMGKQFTVRHLEQELATNLPTHEQGLGGNTHTHEQGSGSGSNTTPTQQDGGETRQNKD